MADVEITPTAIVVHVTGIDRILAMKSSLTIPIQAALDARDR